MEYKTKTIILIAGVVKLSGVAINSGVNSGDLGPQL